MRGLTRDGTAEPVLRDLILRRERGQGRKKSCSADNEQDWQSYPVDPYSAESAYYTYRMYYQYYEPEKTTDTGANPACGLL